jgi:hypothetical protein
MEWPATFGDGAQALAMSWDGALLRLACDRAHPPGRPLELTLRLASGALTLRGKSAGSKRRSDERFDVRVRLHSLRRSDREQLDAAFGHSGAGDVTP